MAHWIFEKDNFFSQRLNQIEGKNSSNSRLIPARKLTQVMRIFLQILNYELYSLEVSRSSQRSRE